MDKNGWFKVIIGSLITIMLSVGGAIYTSGSASGKTEEQIKQLEAKVAVIEVDKRATEILLSRIDERLKNIEILVKELRDRK